MAKLRFNREFKFGIASMLIVFFIGAALTTMAVVSNIQYDTLVAEMVSTEATIIDIDMDYNRKGPDEQKIYIEYEVDGFIYSRKLATDTKVTFAAGLGSDYSVGDKVPIFYDPENPETIASPRTVRVGYAMLAIGLFILAISIFLLFVDIKKRSAFLVTQEEYERQGRELKNKKKTKKKQGAKNVDKASDADVLYCNQDFGRKNLFSINVDETEDDIDAAEFIIRRESDSVSSERDRLNGELSKALRPGVRSFKHFLLYAICYVAAILGVTLGIRTLFGTSNKYLPAMLISFAVAAICFVIMKKVTKKNGADDAITAIDKMYGELNELSSTDLGVPLGAPEVELFQYFYNADGRYHGVYVPDTVKVFREDDNLCMERVGAIIAVPIDSIEAVVKVNAPISFSDWTKDEPYDGAEYAQYNIVKTQVNEYEEKYSMNGYYSIRFSREGKDYEILVPLFEMQPFLNILDKPVEEE